MDEFYKAIYKDDFRIIVNHHGYVQWSFGGQLKTSCQLDLSQYPFDRQQCYIEVVNFVYHVALVGK